MASNYVANNIAFENDIDVEFLWTIYGIAWDVC